MFQNFRTNVAITVSEGTDENLLVGGLVGGKAPYDPQKYMSFEDLYFKEKSFAFMTLFL